jgi:hypothetical protein
MIKNDICENCTHGLVCKRTDKLEPFRIEGNKDLGVTITINECKEFSEVK